MNSPSSPAILDGDYRKMVSDAAGAAYLDTMTADCLQQVEAFLVQRAAPDDATRTQAHRLAGGTATVGLPQLGNRLKALEKGSSGTSADAAWNALYDDCDAALRQAYEALAADASTRSSR